MYGKEEAKQLKRDFWTSFGIYMKKHNLTYGRKINWVNYKTKIKDVYFRLNVDNKEAIFAIELQHQDEGIRELFFEQFQELKVVLEENFKHELIWDSKTINYFGIPISKIGCSYQGISVFDKNSWKDTFIFLEENITAIHHFWEDFHEVFKQLD